MPAPKLVPTSVIIMAAVYACKKCIKQPDGSYKELEPLELIDTTVKGVDGSNRRTKMIFWFRESKQLKEITIAYTNGNILVDPNSFHQKYLDFRNLTFNKGYSGDDE